MNGVSAERDHMLSPRLGYAEARLTRYEAPRGERMKMLGNDRDFVIIFVIARHRRR
jgi:hypothetical protein